MTDRTETYEVEGKPHVALYLQAGDIRLKEAADSRVVISMSGSSEALDAIDIDATSESVTVRSAAKQRRWFGRGSVDTVVKLPAGADVTIHNGAGDILVGPPVGDLEIHAGSGDIRGDRVGGATEIKVGAGDVRMGTLVGPVKVTSASGDVRIDSAGEINVSTAAGDLYLREINDSARVKSATGDIRIRKFAGSDLEIKTMSGDSTIGLVQGMVVKAAIKTMSGDFRNQIKPSAGEKTGTMNLTVTSFAGDVTLKAAK
ncbi:MAG: DUF4097 family beta strand repeat-containing protein [Acidimicrobiia bacterium]